MSMPTAQPDPDDRDARAALDDLANAAATARDAEAELVAGALDEAAEAEADEVLAQMAEARADEDLDQAAQLVGLTDQMEERAEQAEAVGDTAIADRLREGEAELIDVAEALVEEADELESLAEVAHTAAEEAAGAAQSHAAQAVVLDEVADELEVALAEEVVAEALEEAIADEIADEIAEVLDEDALLAESAPEVERPISPYDRPGRWFVVHTQSGYEKKVKQNLEARISSMNMEGRIYEVVIPMEDVVEFKGGKKVVVQKKMFPGYLLVRAMMDDDSWYVIRNTPGVTGFVGQGAKPSPLPRKDVESFLQIKAEDAEGVPAARKGPRLEFEMGESVRIKEGPFADFSGLITEINEDQLKVKVEVDIFGRPTPVELEFAQIAKL